MEKQENLISPYFNPQELFIDEDIYSKQKRMLRIMEKRAFKILRALDYQDGLKKLRESRKLTFPERLHILEEISMEVENILNKLKKRRD